MIRRLALLCALVVLAAACVDAPAEDTTTTSTGDTTTTSVVTTTTVPATTSTVSDELTTTACGESAPEEFAVLCEAVDLVEEHYVDPLDPALLAQAAEQGVRDAELPTEGGPVLCALPADAFLELCEAIDAADVDPERAAEAAVAGIARHALDPNSAYLDPQSLALAREEQTGQVEGIGALVSTEDTTASGDDAQICIELSDTCHMVVVAVLEDTPAERAGLLPGDRIVAVDGKDVNGLSIDDVTALVRGPAGTDVTLTLERDGEERLELTITRAAIDIPISETELVGDVGYLRLNLFTNNADEVVATELSSLLSQGAERIVFDLRNNPGGALTSAVGVASQFLDEGAVLRTEGPEGDRTYEVEPGGVATDPALPVYVVVNAGSASASEVVAGVLQETDRAVIVGMPTFGKNTVQQRFSLPNGGALKLTIARWLTPGGVDLGDGVTPDVRLELGTDLTPTEVVEAVLNAVGVSA